jgi:hypothetical protein
MKQLAFIVLGLTLLLADAPLRAQDPSALTPVLVGLLVPVTVARVQHNELTNGGPGYNCSPSCSLPIASTGSGNLLVLGYNGGANAAVQIASVGAGGSWVASGACAVANSDGEVTDMAYALSSTPGVTSLPVRLSGNDTAASFELAEYSRSSGSWALYGSCQSETGTPNSANTTTGSFPTDGSTDLVTSIMQAGHAYCSGEVVTGAGWTTPIFFINGNTPPYSAAYVDALGVPSGTYQASIVQYPSSSSCTAPDSGYWASSGFAFN